MRVLWPKGFEERDNKVPVVTSCKEGRRLVAEARFVLPPSMELDLDSLELDRMDEAYDPDAQEPKAPAPRIL